MDTKKPVQLSLDLDHKLDEKVMNEFLEVAVQEALDRIRRAYEQTEGKIYLSFSGGKDSTVLGALIKLANLPTAIPFVFADTGIELKATYEFVKEYEYENVVIVKPRKPFGLILKEYGTPAFSKQKAHLLATYQRHLDDPLSTQAGLKLTGKHDYKMGKIADKYFHVLHPDLEYRVANKCCEYMKKLPFKDYEKANDMNGAFTGVRVAEGGIRAKVYTSCTSFRKEGNRTKLMSTPIYDWDDDLIEAFIKKYNIKLSKAYTEYGFSRTGCVGCPYARNTDTVQQLEVLQVKEPLMYKASLKWFGKVYMDQGVVLKNDPEYMEAYNARQAVNAVRRCEMLEKFDRSQK